MRRRLGCALVGLAAALLLAGCNTVAGIGEDVKAVGRAVGIGGEESTEQP